MAMVKTALIVAGGRVKKVLETEGPPTEAQKALEPPGKWVQVPNPDLPIKEHWLYDGDQFFMGTAPVEPPPPKVTNFQARFVLNQMPSPSPDFTLFDLVDNLLFAGKNTPEGKMAWQAWEQANDFYREGALLNQLKTQLGLTSAQRDDLLRAAYLVEF